MPFDGLYPPQDSKNTTLWQSLLRTILRVPSFDPAPAPIPRKVDEQTVQVLVLARSLIGDRKDWVQRRYETRDGRRCAVGALRAAGRQLGIPHRDAQAILGEIAFARGFSDVEGMNDNSRHGQVVRAFHEAIERARASAE